MRTRPFHSRPAFGVGTAALWIASFVLGACTQMLGIDGEYVRRDNSFVGAAGTGGATIIGGGGETGGVAFGSGGMPNTPSTGGSDGGVAPPPLETGGSCSTCPAPTTGCPVGTYAGSLTGQHAASILAGFSLPVTGSVTFSLAPAGGVDTATVNGKIEGSATVGPNSFAAFSAKLSGSFDCARGELKGTIDGSYSLAMGAPPVPFSGTHEGSFVNSMFQGTWSEHETLNPSMSQFFGNGTWNAAIAGP